jgi:hypothetical protein
MPVILIMPSDPQCMSLSELVCTTDAPFGPIICKCPLNKHQPIARACIKSKHQSSGPILVFVSLDFLESSFQGGRFVSSPESNLLGDVFWDAG